MSTALLRKTSLPRLLHGHLRNPIRETHQILGTQTPQTRAYFRFPHFLRKAREYELPPSSFASSFSYSSTASSSRVGFVGWYLGMVKARPVFTKSVTAALIYTAADLSSQLTFVRNLLVPLVVDMMYLVFLVSSACVVGKLERRHALSQNTIPYQATL
ncbi:hypothetical protein HS088_TW17G00734 [Tripterygium wilfordii]|uniref:Uncharacterized protein n=1 Tax=Tripterygium wilfordii TaxID=458696 RepID=A0A7J7CGL8_TRIWF|nr:hypothetical protein HS088_TW17G00734 [Tripterygium wilfordii]